MSDYRTKELSKFYSILEQLEKTLWSERKLSDCHGRMEWPQRGVYFFKEPGETRTNTGKGLRIVRVGTHALKSGSRTSLWKRLSQHKGTTKTGGGNHRTSIFRRLVGTALMQKDGLELKSWGQKNRTKKDKKTELLLEKEVSLVIGNMPFLWLTIEDAPGPESLRGYIEKNSIALLSNHNRPSIDPPSKHWLGHKCNRERVRSSGLWNQNHVDQNYDPSFLDKLELIISKEKKP